MIREHRLINARASTVTTDPTQYNARTAQANADQQAAQYRAQLAANQAQTTGLNAQGQGTLAAPVASVPLNQTLANAQTTYAANAAGQATTMQQSVSPTGQVVQGPITQAQSLDGNGALQQSAIDRMRSEGLSEAEIRSRMGNYSQNVQGAMEQVGQAYQNPDSAFANGGSQSAIDRASGRLTLQQQADKAAEDAKQQYLQMGVGDPALIAQAQSQARQNVLNEQAAQTGLQTAQGQKQQQDLTANASAAAASGKKAEGQASQAPQMTPQQNADSAAASMLLAGLPPEQQSLMAPAINALMSGYQTAEQNAGMAYQGATASAQDTFNKEQGVLGLLGKSYQELKDNMQGVLDDVKEDQLKNIAEQEKVVQERLGWERAKAERELKRQETKVNDQMVARLALSGGFGSDGGLNEINSATAEFESKIADLGVEYSLQQSEVAVKFSTLYTNALDQYKIDSINNMKDYQGNLERLSMQSLSSTRSLNEANQKALETYLGNQTNIRMSKAKEIQGITKDVQSLILQNKADAMSQEKYGMDQLKWVIDTYGSNAPQSILEGIAKKLPGVDVKQILAIQTLEQAKMKKTGSGGGGISGFSISQRSKSGQPITLEMFIAQKEESLGYSGDETERAAWEKEYNANMAAYKAKDPNAIMQQFNVKAARSGSFGTLGAMKIAKEEVENALKSGNVEYAQAIVDGIGAKPPEKTVAQVTTTERVLNDLERMEFLLDSIESNIGPLPTEGALWVWMNENIETTEEYQEMRQLIDSNLAPYSRGISGERGATTEPDVKRSLSSLLDPNVSADALRASLSQAKRQAHESITLYLQGMRDGGYAVNQLQNTYESGSWNTAASEGMNSAQKSFLDSF